MTLGEDRTRIMEDFAAVVSPYCTVDEFYFESDCGDALLARVFFILWKVLSTYLFTSLFISLVYESFSHVYEGFTIKSGTITREDLRQFKDAWALVDPKGTGYISPESIAKFTALLSGQLSMQVYEESFSIPKLLKDCSHRLPLHPGEVDLERLRDRLATILVQDIRERRRAMDRFLRKDQRLDISIQTLLITLVSYKIVDDRECLRLVSPYVFEIRC
jgi:Ca2+-binding EF-hand superfamily protein